MATSPTSPARRIGILLGLLLLAGGGVVAYVVGPATERVPSSREEGTLGVSEPSDATSDGEGTHPAAPVEAVGPPPRPSLEARPGAAAAPDGTEAAPEPAAAPAASDGGRPPLTAEEKRSVIPLNPFQFRLPGPSAGGDGGGPRPTENWTRYPFRGLPRGTARLSVAVRDLGGAPVAGAEIYLGRPEVAGRDAVSFGDLRKIGVTGAEGTLSRDDLPVGSASVLANLMGETNGPRGLDARSGVSVVLRATDRAEVEVRLPIALAERGTIQGTVLGAEGRPQRAAEVWRGRFDRVYTDAAGRFELRRVPAGPAELTVRASAHAPETTTVEVPAGGTAEVTLRLRLAEEGSLDVRGRVVGPSGEPIPGATVHAIGPVANGQGTLRTVKTDDGGSFALIGLPDRLRTTPWRIQADGFPRHPAANREMTAESVGEDVILTLPPPRVRLRVSLRDASTGEILDRGLVRADPLDAPERRAASASYDAGSASYETWLAAGRWRVTAEALDHTPEAREVDLAEGEDPAAPVEFRLRPDGPPSVEVRLVVQVLSTATETAVPNPTVEVLDAVRREPLARTSGGGAGPYWLPAPSGRRILRVSAPGHETSETEIDVPREEAFEVTVHLRPE